MREMTAYAIFEVLGLSYIDHFAGMVMKIIHPGGIWQLLHLFPGQVRWQGLLFGAPFYELLYMWFGVMLQQVFQQLHRGIGIAASAVPVFNGDAKMPAQVAQ